MADAAARGLVAAIAISLLVMALGVVLESENIPARQREPATPVNIMTPVALTLRHATIADCARSDETSASKPRRAKGQNWTPMRDQFASRLTTVWSVTEFKKALAGQSFKSGGRTRARTWNPLIKSLIFQK